MSNTIEDREVRQFSQNGEKSTAAVSDSVHSQIVEGQADLNKSMNDHHEARKQGMRDKITKEVFGTKPEFFDSSKFDDKVQFAVARGSEVGTVQFVSDYKSANRDASDKTTFTDLCKDPKKRGYEIARDEEGYVTNIKGSQGWNARYSYDLESHELVGITYSTGRKITKDKIGAGWTDTNPAGEQHDFHGDIRIAPNGDEVRTSFGGQRVTYHPDRSIDQAFSDKTALHRDSYFRITAINRGSGKVDRVSYDDKGNPIGIDSTSDDSKWRKEPSGWNQYDNKGKVIGHANTIDFNNDGSIVRQSCNGQVARQERDGSTTIGTVGVLSEDGRIKEITYPDGKKIMCGYNEKGELNSIVGQGKEITNTAGKWDSFDEKTNTYNEVKAVTLTPSGYLIIDGQESTRYQRTDGTVHVIMNDKTEVMLDTEGRVTEYKHANGEAGSIMYDKQGLIATLRTKDFEIRKEEYGYTTYRDGKKVGHWDGSLNVDKYGSVYGFSFDGKGFVRKADGRLLQLPRR